MKTGKAIACIAALALLPLIPYLFVGYGGQDFELHATSWMELRNVWLSGHLTPVWASLANYGLGDPHLGMYPPASMYAGGLIALLLPMRLAPGAFIWMALMLSGLSMYFASKPFLAQRDRPTAAALYMLSPYLITTAIVRFAAAELLVQAWLPLIFACFYGVVWKREKAALFGLGLLLGLSWIANVPESIVLFYVLLIGAAICAGIQRAVMPVLLTLTAEALAAALAAFYLAPVWRERVWVHQQNLVRTDPRQLLLFMRYHGAGVETLKVFKYSLWLFACAGIVAIALCLWRRATPLRDDAATQTWVSLATVAFFFQLPIALVLWRHLPQLSNAAFPFRFLPLMGAALPLVLLAPGAQPSLRKPVYTLVALLTLVPVFEHVRTQMTYDTRVPPIAVLESRWSNDGYEGMPEFVPAAGKKVLGPTDVAAAVGSGCLVDAGATPRAFSITATEPCTVRLAVFDYPFWRAVDEAGDALPTTADANGLVVVTPPPGTHSIHLEFVPKTMLRTVSAGVSVVSLLLVLFGLTWIKRSDTQLRASTPMA